MLSSTALERMLSFGPSDSSHLLARCLYQTLQGAHSVSHLPSVAGTSVLLPLSSFLPRIDLPSHKPISSAFTPTTHRILTLHLSLTFSSATLFLPAPMPLSLSMTIGRRLLLLHSQWPQISVVLSRHQRVNGYTQIA